MSNAFQDQLLKAGLVTKQQVQKANKTKHKKTKQQSKKEQTINEAKLKAQQQATEKSKRDLELNKKKEHQARQKAISIEINQLITDNTIKRDEKCEIIYNFEHQKKIKRIYINEEMKQKIINGQLGIARIEGRYELVPKLIAERIQQRNEKRIILFTDEEQSVDENDPYSDYKIPDDLTW
ncbi:MAG: DUF2058 domain-containing protein [Gammaproteobacteria bacterium]